MSGKKVYWFEVYPHLPENMFTYYNSFLKLSEPVPWRYDEDKGFQPIFKYDINGYQWKPIGYTRNPPGGSMPLHEETFIIGILFENEYGDKYWGHYLVTI